MTRVVIVATPASARDIHRLVAGASVYGNAEKAAMVHRLLTGWSCRCADRWRC
jgi:predicted polyphosphate/ATP-dependent NAD kinase